MTPQRRFATCALLSLGWGCSHGQDHQSVGQLTTTEPVAGTLPADPENALRITLGTDVDSTVTIATSSVELRHLGTAMPVTVDYDALSRTASIRPQQPLARGAVHEVVVRDASGSGWQHAWRFATNDDRFWQPLAAVGNTQWVRRPNGELHAYWTDATPQAHSGLLPPGSATVIPEGSIGSGSLLTAGLDPAGFETVLLQTTGVDAYYRLPGGTWNGPAPSPTVPSGGVVHGYSGGRTAPDGTVAFFTYWFFYHSAGTNVVPFSATSGWLPSSEWSYGMFFPVPPIRSAIDWISTSRLVRVVATTVDGEWQVQSRFVANQPLAIVPGVDEVVPTVVANKNGQALFAWCAKAGDTWTVHATTPTEEFAIATTTSLGTGTGTTSSSRASAFLGPSGHAAVVLPVGTELRVWRYSPASGWSNVVTFPSGPDYTTLLPPVFAVGIDDDGDVLLVKQRDDAIVAYRGYVDLGWSEAERIDILDPTTPVAGSFDVLHDPVAGDIVRWSTGSTVTMRRRL